MNILVVCNYPNCYLQFKNVYDQISHYETKHLPENDWKRIRDIDELERNLENSTDTREKEKIQEHLNALYNQPLRMSLFFKLDPYAPNHIVNPQEKKPLTLQFTNYRKRPAQNQPMVSVTPKKSSKNMNGADVATSENGGDERKYHCKVEGCTKAYKNSAGLRSHMRSVHNGNSQQVPSISPSPNYGSNAHISYQPSNQSYYAQRPEDTKPMDQTGHHPQTGSIGALATFNSTTSRLHGSDEGFTQPPSNANVNYRAGSRLTPSEENILNRNLTTLSAAPPRSTTPVSQSGQQRVQEAKFKCDFCPKTYKTNSNLQKHIKDNHRQQQADTTANAQRPVLSTKNVLRTYSIGSNQGAPSTPQPTQQQPAVSSVQQAKNTLLSAKNTQPGARSPASPNMMSNSPNLSPAPHINTQSPAPQRQITVNNQPNVQQRTYVQTRTYAPVQTQSQNQQQQPIYHLQQIQQQPSSNDTPQSLDIQIPQSQSASSPRNYSSSPVTVVLQSQQQPSPTVQNEHYQPTGQTSNVRMPGARTYNPQQYYERYQTSVQQRRPANKAYSTSTGTYNYQPKQIKQVYRQPTNPEYSRVTPSGSGSINRVNTVSSTGQPVRISSLNTQSGAPISSMMNTSQNMMNSANTSSASMPTTYQVRTNFDNSRRSPQVQSNSLSSQLTPLNLNYGGSTTTTTSIDGIQITKVTPSQYGNPRIRATSSGSAYGAIRGRLNDNVRGGSHSGVYNQSITPRYSGPGMPQYTQRSIMRVIQTQPSGSNNSNVMQQEQRSTSQQQQQSHNTSDN